MTVFSSVTGITIHTTPNHNRRAIHRRPGMAPLCYQSASPCHCDRTMVIGR
jgi:hypothetical protein